MKFDCGTVHFSGALDIYPIDGSSEKIYQLYTLGNGFKQVVYRNETENGGRR